MPIRVGLFYAGLGCGVAYCLSKAERVYDIDGANRQYSVMHQSNQMQLLPSEYDTRTLSLQDLRYEFRPVNGSIDCTPLQLDDATEQWLQEEGRPQSWLQTLWYNLLGLVLPDAEVQALTQLPTTHFMSSQMWEQLLGGTQSRAANSTALDVGAACGHVTTQFAPLFGHVFATEISDGAVQALNEQGFTGVNTANISTDCLVQHGLPTHYDAVFALNLLDRVENSAAFLEHLIAAVAPGGVLVIGLPLPYFAKQWAPHSDTCAESWAQSHALPLGENTTWDEATASVVQVLEARGLRVSKVVRAPYLSQESWPVRIPFHALDGAVFVAHYVAGDALPLEVNDDPRGTA